MLFDQITVCEQAHSGNQLYASSAKLRFVSGRRYRDPFVML